MARDLSFCLLTFVGFSEGCLDGCLILVLYIQREEVGYDFYSLNRVIKRKYGL